MVSRRVSSSHDHPHHRRAQQPAMKRCQSERLGGGCSLRVKTLLSSKSIHYSLDNCSETRFQNVILQGWAQMTSEMRWTHRRLWKPFSRWDCCVIQPQRGLSWKLIQFNDHHRMMITSLWPRHTTMRPTKHIERHVSLSRILWAKMAASRHYLCDYFCDQECHKKWIAIKNHCPEQND